MPPICTAWATYTAISIVTVLVWVWWKERKPIDKPPPPMV